MLNKLTDFGSSEGVLVAKKDYNLPKHGDIDTKNLYVRCAFPTWSPPCTVANMISNAGHQGYAVS